MKIIDASDLIIGRLASFVAKAALMGEKIVIVNCKNAVITGNKSAILSTFRLRRSIGTPQRGPFFSRQPDRIIRRTIRGMLPYKRENGKKAFKNVMCYIGIPEKYKNEKLISLNKADVSKLPNYKYTTLENLCKLI